MAYDVFLSYARADHARAAQIKSLLEELGLSVFFDTDGLDGGDVFPDVLDREVKSAGAIVGVWSKHALTRPWVKIECDIGRTRGVLVPIQIEPIADLDRPAAFWNIQFSDLSDFYGQSDHVGWWRFLRSLSRTLDRVDLLERHAERQANTAEDGSRELQAELAAMRNQISDMARSGQGATRNESSSPQRAATTSADKPKRHRFGLLAGLVILATLLGVAGYWFVQRPVAPQTFAWERMSDQDWIRQEVMTLLRRVEAETAFSDLAARAEAGSAAAYTATGLAQMEGYRIKDGDAGARLSFRAGCNRDHIPACFFLGMMHAQGRGGSVDIEAAFEHLNKACSERLFEACHSMAYYYDQYPDEEYQLAATELYRQACDGGVNQACNPQRRYSSAELNASKTLNQLESACNKSDGEACWAAADAYISGDEVSEDRNKAKGFYRAACDLNKMEACWIAGILHEQDGEFRVARALYDRACLGGSADGCSERDNLDQRLATTED
ncbi:MAG: toll/interleukin-1 receptor domain-containing protein [Pseudomonadota bacterium]